MALNADLLYKLTEKKKYSDLLSTLYSSFNMKVAGTISECCSEMYVNDKGEFTRTWFCKNKFCPVCAFHRSRLMEARMFPTVEQLYKSGFDFVFVTYTVPSCPADQLRSVILKMSKATSDLQAKYRRSFRGSFKGLEVTFNKKTGLYHPHYHVLYVVDRDYFITDKYFSHDRLASVWTGLCGLRGKIFDDDGNEINAVVDIRKVYANSFKKTKDYIGSIKAVVECSKYPFKLDSLFSLPELELQCQVLQTLHKSLYNIKMYSFSGILKQVEKEINQFRDNFHFIQLEALESQGSVFHNYSWNSNVSRYLHFGDFLAYETRFRTVGLKPIPI